MNKIIKVACVLLTLVMMIPVFTTAQSIDHWETVVNHNDTWYYKLGDSTIPNTWIDSNFDASSWNQSQGGFGYGDNDDNTIVDNTISIYSFINFQLLDTSIIQEFVLHGDYDDGFIAYLNGQEIARKNIGDNGPLVPYDQEAAFPHEANIFRDETPETFLVPNSFFQEGVNKLAIQVHNTSLNSSDLSSNFYLSVGLKSNDQIYSPTPTWFDLSVFSTMLPIIKITTLNSEEIVDEPKITAHMGVISNPSNQLNRSLDLFNDYDGLIGIEIRGTSSQLFDKKGYGFETKNSDGSNNNVNLLGMPEENDWVLHGPYSDKSLMRNVLAYHLASLTGQYAPRTRLCELFINDQYKGVYMLTEKIKRDKNRVDISKLDKDENEGDDLTGGYIIKVDRNDQNIPNQGWYSTFPSNKFFAYVSPKDDDITSTQKNYIQDYMYDFELAMSQNDYLNTYKDHIDEKSWVDYFLATEVTKHIDAYKLSFYMYKDKDSKGGKLHMGPIWDINFGFGNFDFDCSPEPSGWAYEFPLCGNWHPFWTRKINDIPNIQNLTACRWQELREGPLKTDALLEFIDQKVQTIGIASSRNFRKWPIIRQYVWGNFFVGDSYLEEINYLKDWLSERLIWLDQNMKGNCEDYVSSSKTIKPSDFYIYPNPVLNKIDINISDQTMNVTGLEIVNINGQKLKDLEWHYGQRSIDVSDLDEGLYYLILKSKGTIRTHKLFFKNKN